MEEQTASSTAGIMLMHRAHEKTLPENDQIIIDPYAMHFLYGRIKKALNSFVGRFIVRFVMNNVYPGVNGAIIFRARFIDDVVNSCVKEGVEQIVILGAGYDTRAFRLDALKEKTIVFELDHPATQKIKKERVQTLFSALPDHVKYIPVDFEKDNIEKELLSNDYNPGKKTLFILEGLVMYLSSKKVEEILTLIKTKSAKGSFITLDYLPSSMIDGTIKLKEARNMIKLVLKTGEPFRFGLDRENAEKYFSDHGFEVLKNISASEHRDLYFKGRNEKRKISTIFSFMLAKT
jgi:methyltransferase (TIGR00027 family)